MRFCVFSELPEAEMTRCSFFSLSASHTIWVPATIFPALAHRPSVDSFTSTVSIPVFLFYAGKQPLFEFSVIKNSEAAFNSAGFYEFLYAFFVRTQVNTAALIFLSSVNFDTVTAFCESDELLLRTVGKTG